ncbi:MAG: DUF1571 domain-containing protein [Gemmataceae bacterium]|nr:DUF1571 domain-containing protein [Gemmataceae bacterium]MCI0739073.1 DUF1571 domain-containing protein [Gemmataceae bacterium]
MLRWLVLLLPICLILQDQRPLSQTPRLFQSEAVAVVPVRPLIKGSALMRQQLLAGMALDMGQQFPAALPWVGMYEIGKNDLYPLEMLLQYHPILFLQMCLDRYEREVKGYTTRFHKREIVQGKMQDAEKIECHFREQPFSIHMHWLEGSGLAKKALYVEGENNGKLLARPKSPLLALRIWDKDVDGPDAKRSGRYTIAQFGMKQGTERTVAAMQRAEARGALHVRYVGLFQVPELDNRQCYKFVRMPYAPVEEEGVNELILYVDRETWLQSGSILKDAKGNLIAEYWFRDIKLNPTFDEKQFTRDAL